MLNVFINGKKQNDKIYLNFINQLKVGDIITQRRRKNEFPTETTDHTIVVYDFKYNNGKKIDCIIIEAVYGNFRNIQGGVANKKGDKLEAFGAIRKSLLSKRLELYANKYKYQRI